MHKRWMVLCGLIGALVLSITPGWAAQPKAGGTIRTALGMVGTMVVAMLLTTVGPAAIGPDPFLGLLPQPRLADSAAWGPAWTTMMTQWVVLMSALGLVCAGAGALSIDRLVFGGRSGSARLRDEDDLD